MLLKNYLYQILESEKNDSGFAYSIQISDKHPIFKGHFPESPILPGVCILQIFKELSEDTSADGTALQYSEIKQCKFQTPVLINGPRIIQVNLNLQHNEESWALTASVKDKDCVFAIIKALFSEIKN